MLLDEKETVLNKGTRIKVILKPKICKNTNNEISVHYNIIYSHPTKTIPDPKLISLKAGQKIQIKLSKDCINDLIQNVLNINTVAKLEGIKYGKRKLYLFEVSEGSEDIENIINIMNTLQNTKFSVNDLCDIILKNNDKCDFLDKFNTANNINNLKNMIEIFKKNIDDKNKDEQFWQDTFKNYPYLLSQIFCLPFYLFQKEGFVGGKSIDNKDGKIVDFIFKNKLSNNISLIEIKTPKTNIIEKKTYRNGTYNMSIDFIGAVNQVLNYRDEIYKSYSDLLSNSKENFFCDNIRCILIVGNISSLDDNQKNTFNRYRNELRNIEIVTYDELLKKMEMLLNLFISPPTSSTE